MAIKTSIIYGINPFIIIFLVPPLLTHTIPTLMAISELLQVEQKVAPAAYVE